MKESQISEKSESQSNFFFDHRKPSVSSGTGTKSLTDNKRLSLTTLNFTNYYYFVHSSYLGRTKVNMAIECLSKSNITHQYGQSRVFNLSSKKQNRNILFFVRV